jgi:hypothetical protein
VVVVTTGGGVVVVVVTGGVVVVVVVVVVVGASVVVVGLVVTGASVSVGLPMPPGRDRVGLPVGLVVGFAVPLTGPEEVVGAVTTDGLVPFGPTTPPRDGFFPASSIGSLVESGLLLTEGVLLPLPDALMRIAEPAPRAITAATGSAIHGFQSNPRGPLRGRLSLVPFRRDCTDGWYGTGGAETGPVYGAWAAYAA